MTIRLPGILDEINPVALQGISSVVNNIVNPNAPQQLALRQMMLQNPELQQQLTDMGAQRVEEVYGKGTGGFAGSGPKSLKKQVEDTKGAEIQRILTSGTPQEKEELLSSMVGTKTSEERKLQGLQTTSVQQQVDLQGQKISDQQAVDAVANRIHARLGSDPKSGDLYTMSQQGVIKPDELMTLLKDPTYAQKYNNDQQDFWSRRQDFWNSNNANLEQQRINAMRQGNRMQFQEYKDRIDYSRAAQIAEKYGGNIDAIVRIQKDPTLVDKYTAPGFKPVTPEDKANQEAAQNIQRMRTDLYGAAKNDAIKEFRLQTQKEDAVLYARGSTPDAKQAAIREKNIKARDILGPVFGQQVPEWHYDDKLNKHLLGMSLGSDQYYRTGGDPNLFGSDETYVPKDAASNDPVDMAAHDIVAGKQNLNEMLAKAPTDSLRNALKARVVELQKSGGVPDTVPGSAAQSISTGADSTVAARLKISQGEPLNLNVGTSVKPKPDVNIPNPPAMSDSVFADAVKKGSAGVITKAVLSDSLSDAELNKITAYFRQKGIIKEPGPSISAMPDEVTIQGLDLMSRPEVKLVLRHLKKLGKFVEDPSKNIEAYYSAAR